MSQVLRQSTQVIVVIGPFVDVADGFTPETGITLAAADEAELLKANTTTTTDISGATFAAITGCDGWYGLTLTTTLTDTVGALTVMVNDDSVCLPVFARFQVIEEAAYDAMYAASADPKADINVASIDAGAITATAIATGAIDADALAADAVAEIADGVWDEDATGHQTQGTFGQAIGDPAADTNTIFKAVVTDATGATVGVDVAAVLADTGTDGVVVASINAGAITAAAIANGAIDAATFAADVDAEILSYIVDDATRIDASALNTATGTTIPAILDDTDDIGVAGAGLTDLGGMSTTMKAQVQTESEDALVVHRLDELLNADSDIDGAAPPTVGSVFHELLTKTAGSFTYDQTTDSLEALRDNIGTAGAGLTAIDLPDQTMNITGDITGNLSGSVGSVTGAVGSVTGAVGSVAAGGITAASIATDAIDNDAIAANAVTEIQAGLATAASIAALNNISAAQVNAEVDTALADVGLTTTITGRIDVAVSSRLASAGYTAPDNASITAIKAKTDSLTFTTAGEVDSNLQSINDTALQGTGSGATPWAPV